MFDTPLNLLHLFTLKVRALIDQGYTMDDMELWDFEIKDGSLTAFFDEDNNPVIACNRTGLEVRADVFDDYGKWETRNRRLTDAKGNKLADLY